MALSPNDKNILVSEMERLKEEMIIYASSNKSDSFSQAFNLRASIKKLLDNNGCIYIFIDNLVLVKHKKRFKKLFNISDKAA